MVMIRNMLIISDMGRPSSFTKDQMVNIVLWWGELQNVFKVRRKYAKHYGIDRHTREVPAIRSFKTVIDRFSKTGSTLPMKDPGPQKTARTEENISRVRTVINENKSLSVRQIAIKLDLSTKTVWQILRKDIKEIVDDFCESLDPDEIRRAVANVRKRAAACIECGGGHFEHLLKRARKDTAEE